MSDRQAPTLEVVEDRVRRTFAARAEDVASGDDDTGDLDDIVTGTGRARSAVRPGRARVLLLAAAVVVVAAVSAAGVALAVRGGDGDGSADVATDGRVATEAAELATASRSLLDALRDERNLTVVHMLGQEQTIRLPVTDLAQARASTDAAVAAHVALVDQASASDDGPDLDGLASLAQLRLDVDAMPEPGDFTNVDSAMDVSAAYGEIVDTVLFVDHQVALAIDDPEVRVAVEAYRHGLKLQHETNELFWATLVFYVSGADDSESVAELSRHLTAVEAEVEVLQQSSAGQPFEDAAASAVEHLRETGLVDAATAVLEGRGIDLSALFEANMDTPADEGLPAFLDELEDVIAGG